MSLKNRITQLERSQRYAEIPESVPFYFLPDESEDPEEFRRIKTIADDRTSQNQKTIIFTTVDGRKHQPTHE